jgi:hypothetical protein
VSRVEQGEARGYPFQKVDSIGMCGRRMRHEAMLGDCVPAGHYLRSVSNILNEMKKAPRKAHKNDACVVSSSFVTESPEITAIHDREGN